MTPIKRIEIVLDAAHTPQLIRSLKAASVPGYTLVRDVQGSGDRGDRMGDELANVYRNCYVIIAASEDVAQRVIEAVRPLIRDHGGMCLISDAQWIKH